MTEFVSKLEEVLPAEELFIDPTPGFGRYKKFLKHAIEHPAKMNTKLLELLIKKFTKKGDVVLDPLAGSGSTGVMAALHGRNAINVELERKFFDWMEGAREKTEKLTTLTKKGWIKNIHGDSRRLSELLGQQTDVVLTSPPYSESIKEGNVGLVGIIEKESGIPRKVFLKDKEKLKEAIEIANKKKPFTYSINPENIGNLKHGDIDAVITSPPYSESMNARNPISTWSEESKRKWWNNYHFQGGGMSYEEFIKYQETHQYSYSDKKNNIGNLKHGDIDAVITSPPYEGSLEGTSRHTKGGIPERDARLGQTGTYADIDAVITSPPYEETLSSSKAGKAIRTGQTKIHTEKHLTRTYTDDLNKKNIGNLKGETYLTAMLQVYQEMWNVLKPNGLSIIVIKPFIRNKKVVDLPYQTYQLLQTVGFELIDLYKLRLKNPSFWRVLYYKKHPQVPKLKHEYILIGQKTESNGDDDVGKEETGRQLGILAFC